MIDDLTDENTDELTADEQRRIRSRRRTTTAADDTDPAASEPDEPKQRKRRAEHHAELLMGLANQNKQADATEPDELELWDVKFVQRFFGGIKPLHVSTLYRGVQSGRYPPPVYVSVNVVRWVGAECRAARQRMLDERGTPKPPPRRGRPRKAASAAKAKTATETA